MQQDDDTPAIDMKKALLDPASAFASPQDVVENTGLTNQQKIEILRRWEYDASEESVAAEEGMGEVDADRLAQVVRALQSLTGALDLDHTPPTKQGGYDRSSVKTGR